MGNNWIELNLPKDAEEIVRHGAELYKAVYLDTIDNIFDIARGIATLQKYHYNMGTRGEFAVVLVQYGYTARDGGVMNKAVRSHLKTLLENEQSVRDWWQMVNDPNNKKKYPQAHTWLSASAIHKHWRASQQPPDRIRKPSPYVQMQATNIELQNQLHKATAEIRELRSDDGGNFFTRESSTQQMRSSMCTGRHRRSCARSRASLSRPRARSSKRSRPRDRKARPARRLPSGAHYENARHYHRRRDHVLDGNMLRRAAAALAVVL
jgi:hypothetical protein